MTESQAKEILAFAKSFAGLSEEQPSIDGYKFFLYFTVRPIFASDDYRAVLKKFFVDNAEDLLGKLLEFQVEGKLDLGEVFRQAILEKCGSATEGTDFTSAVSDLTKYLRKRFLWKFTEMEKSLRTQLIDALDHKDFEHSGKIGSRVFTRNYWPAGKIAWDVFYGELVTTVSSEGIDYPPTSISAYPDDGTQLPYPKDVRKALHEIFNVIQKKIGFNPFYHWLETGPYGPPGTISTLIEKTINEGRTKDDSKDYEEMSENEFIAKSEELFEKLKPSYQKTFTHCFIWSFCNDESLGYKEMSKISGTSISTLQEHIQKIIYRDFFPPLTRTRGLKGSPDRASLFLAMFEHFRKKYSEHNPEKNNPELFKEIKGS